MSSKFPPALIILDDSASDTLITLTDWRTRVLRRFQLDRGSVRLCYTEHERTFAEHRTAVFGEFGLPELSAHRRVGECRQ